MPAITHVNIYCQLHGSKMSRKNRPTLKVHVLVPVVLELASFGDALSLPLPLFWIFGFGF